MSSAENPSQNRRRVKREGTRSGYRLRGTGNRVQGRALLYRRLEADALNLCRSRLILIDIGSFDSARTAAEPWEHEQGSGCRRGGSQDYKQPEPVSGRVVR